MQLSRHHREDYLVCCWKRRRVRRFAHPTIGTHTPTHTHTHTHTVLPKPLFGILTHKKHERHSSRGDSGLDCLATCFVLHFNQNPITLSLTVGPAQFFNQQGSAYLTIAESEIFSTPRRVRQTDPPTLWPIIPAFLAKPSVCRPTPTIDLRLWPRFCLFFNCGNRSSCYTCFPFTLSLGRAPFPIGSSDFARTRDKSAGRRIANPRERESAGRLGRLKQGQSPCANFASNKLPTGITVQ